MQEVTVTIWKYVRVGPCMACDDEWARLYKPIDSPSLHVVAPPELCIRCRKRYGRDGEVPLHETNIQK